MQMMRLNIKRHNTVGAKSVEIVDLDEKIRRIREENKRRELRFQEIEQDRKMALDPILTKKESYSANKGRKDESLDKNHTDTKSQPCKNTTMKGVQSANMKIAKGRGQRLMEMINNPLKAEHFKSKIEGQMDILEEHLNQTFKLKNNCRSNIREKIKTKNRVCSDTEPVVRHEGVQESDVSEKLVCIPEGQQNEISKDEILLKEDKESIQLLDNIQEDDNYREGNVAPCKTNQQNNETDQILDNVEQQGTVNEMKETNTSNKQLGKDPSSTTQKKDKPKITITLKKTASSSSFDESMAKLSPLDVPTNWGDLDFSDEELPPMSIWKNP